MSESPDFNEAHDFSNLAIPELPTNRSEKSDFIDKAINVLIQKPETIFDLQTMLFDIEDTDQKKIANETLNSIAYILRSKKIDWSIAEGIDLEPSQTLELISHLPLKDIREKKRTPIEKIAVALTKGLLVDRHKPEDWKGSIVSLHQFVSALLVEDISEIELQKIYDLVSLNYQEITKKDGLITQLMALPIDNLDENEEEFARMIYEVSSVSLFLEDKFRYGKPKAYRIFMGEIESDFLYHLVEKSNNALLGSRLIYTKKYKNLAKKYPVLRDYLERLSKATANKALSLYLFREEPKATNFLRAVSLESINTYPHTITRVNRPLRQIMHTFLGSGTKRKELEMTIFNETSNFKKPQRYDFYFEDLGVCGVSVIDVEQLNMPEDSEVFDILYASIKGQRENRKDFLLEDESGSAPIESLKNKDGTMFTFITTDLSYSRYKQLDTQLSLMFPKIPETDTTQLSVDNIRRMSTMARKLNRIPTQSGDFYDLSKNDSLPILDSVLIKSKPNDEMDEGLRISLNLGESGPFHGTTIKARVLIGRGGISIVSETIDNMFINHQIMIKSLILDFIEESCMKGQRQEVLDGSIGTVEQERLNKTNRSLPGRIGRIGMRGSRQGRHTEKAEEKYRNTLESLGYNLGSVSLLSVLNAWHHADNPDDPTNLTYFEGVDLNNDSPISMQIPEEISILR